MPVAWGTPRLDSFQAEGGELFGMVQQMETGLSVVIMETTLSQTNLIHLATALYGRTKQSSIYWVYEMTHQTF